MTWKSLNKSGLLLGLGAVLLSLVLSLCPFLEPFRSHIDLISLDTFIRIPRSRNKSRVVIVAIDEDSIRRVGPWQWPRKVYAELVTNLKKAGARVIAFDLMLDSKKSGDEVLAGAMIGTRVVLSAYSDEPLGRKISHRGVRVDKILFPEPLLCKHAYAIGHIAMIYDADGVVRRIPIFLSDGKNSVPAFGIEIAMAYQNEKKQEIIFSGNRVVMGDFIIPVDNQGSFYIGYRGGLGTVPRVSAASVLFGEVPEEVFRGKAVIIGVTTSGISDRWVTPFIKEGAMPGVEIHANVVEAVLSKAIPYDAPVWLWLIIMVLAGISAGFAGETAPPLTGLGLLLLGLVATWAVGASLYALLLVVVPVTPVGLSWISGILLAFAHRLWSYRKGLEDRREHLRRLSSLFQSSSPEYLCSLLADTVKADRVYGIFRTGDAEVNVLEWPPEKNLPLELSYLLNANESFENLGEKLKQWALRQSKTWLLIEIANMNENLGWYLLGKNSNAFGRADVKKAEDFATHTGVLLRNRLLLSQLKIASEGVRHALLKTMEHKSPDLYRHSVFVARISELLGVAAGLSNGEVRILREAALFHDIGLLSMPNKVLEWNDLTPEERIWIETHPVLGFEILNNIPFLKKGARIVYHHHERYDGKGYPDGLEGAEIPFESRIIMISDTFMVYVQQGVERKQEMNVANITDEFLKKISAHSGTMFDPGITKIMLSIRGKLVEVVKDYVQIL